MCVCVKNVKCLFMLLPFIKRDFLLCATRVAMRGKPIKLPFYKGNAVVTLVESDFFISQDGLETVNSHK